MRHLVSGSSFQGDIVKYYELFFYSGKEQYIEEVVTYIDNCVGGISEKSVIDIGCGTGVFDECFAKKGAKVLAVDISEDMIDFAKENHADEAIVYEVHDICKTPLNKKNDLAIALSHVIGYQLDNNRLRAFLNNISKSLKPGGIFAFNFYNEPAILCGELDPQFREIHENGIFITRISSAKPDHMNNALEMKYRYLIEREGNELIDIKIEEKMRYYSLMELENCLHNAGFKIRSVNNFMSKDDLSWNEWNGFIVAEKISN